MNNVEEILNAFAKEVIRQSRSNLTRQGKRATSNLYKNIDYDLDASQSGQSFSLDFGMRIGGRLQKGYMDFLDQGVKGADPSKVKGGSKAIRGQQAANSPYKFGSGKVGKYDQWIRSLTDWVNRKRLRLRDEKGRFIKGNSKTLAHIIAGNIYNRGIRPSMFFTRSFENAFRHLPDDLEEAFALDVEDLIEFTFRNNNIKTE